MIPLETDIELWDARIMDWEDDDFYALLTTEFDEVVIQDYYGDKTGHRTDAFITTHVRG